MIDVPVLIPAYNPDEKLVVLISELVGRGVKNIVVVNDGSSSESDDIFRKLEDGDECTVIHHAVNLGKGRALKTGFNHCLLEFKAAPGVVTADADGQHKVGDICRVMESLAKNPAELILGVREFRKDIPFRSLLGNVVTRYVFAFLYGKKISDTQSGLRGIPSGYMKELMEISGERYEFEIGMLIRTKGRGITVREIEIETVYIDDNSSSHFNPLLDSFRIYIVLFRFLTSSLLAWSFDIIAFLAFFGLTDRLDVSFIAARVLSSFLNYYVNRGFVFQSRERVAASLIKYYMLVLLIGLTGFWLIKTIHMNSSVTVVEAKIGVEVMLFFVSFIVQQSLVFRKSSENYG